VKKLTILTNQETHKTGDYMQLSWDDIQGNAVAFSKKWQNAPMKIK